MQAMTNFMKTKIITNENDRIGLIFYNSGKSNNKLKYQGINVVLNLDFPDAEKINFVQNLHLDFNAQYGCSTVDVPLY